MFTHIFWKWSFVSYIASTHTLSILPYNVQYLIMSEHSHNCGFKYFMTQKLSQNNKKCKLDVKFQNYEIKPFPILLRVLPLLNAFLCI